MLYIHHHLGLGDHFVCNGLVREFAKTNRPIGLFCKHHNLSTISYMYRDLQNLKLIGINDDKDVLNVDAPCLRIGFGISQMICQAYRITWDQSFYAQYSLDFSKRWTSFYFQRDSDRENSIFLTLNPIKERYALIHSLGSDGIDRLNHSAVDPTLKVIRIEKGATDNLLDYAMLIENATEIHCVDSSFKHLCDSFRLTAKAFYHNMPARGEQHQQQNNWILV